MLRIFTILLLILVISCSSIKDQEIIINEFDGFSEVKLGENAKIKWSFSNAIKVRIENRNRNYEPIDSLDFFTDKNTVLDFLVFNNSDTIRLKWRIVVRNNENIKTGPENISINIYQPSYLESNYFSNLISVGLTPGISKSKMIRNIYNDKYDSLYVRFLLLDEFGNLITGISENLFRDYQSKFYLNLTNKVTNINYSDFKEIKYDSNYNIDMAICLDNSVIAGEYYPVFEQIKNFAKNLNSNDGLHLRTFNQNLITNITLQKATEFYRFIKDFKLEKPSGLSAIYKHLYNTLNYLNYASNKDKIIVLIAYSSDNNSLIYDRNDIVELASQSKIPIYVIGVGSAVDTYSFKYLTEMTGGIFYQLDNNDIKSIYNILTEINLSQKTYYEVKIPFDFNTLSNNKFLELNFEIKKKDNLISDIKRIRLAKERHYFKYQSIASFDFKDTLPSSDFNESIKSLSMILKNNPDKVIEIIGNSSIEGTPDEVYNLGLKRAQSIRKLLIEDGVNPAQIRVRSDGSNNPIYYIQENSWMQYFNRRAEIRWLDPELLPYELIGQSFDSELEALKEVERWEDKGYKVYYERYLSNNIPIYRLKIWGYRTQDEAERALQNIEKRYAVKMTVQ